MIKIERNEKLEIVGIAVQDEIINHLVIMNCLVGRLYVAGCIVEDVNVVHNVTTKEPTLEANEVMPTGATKPPVPLEPPAAPILALVPGDP